MKEKNASRGNFSLRVKKSLKYQAILALVFMALFSLHDFAIGASGKIIITEIMFDPDGTDSKREWVEIYNDSEDDIDVASWKFFEGGSNHGLSFVDGSSILESGGYAVIVDDKNSFLADYPEFEGMLIDSAFSLSNTGEEIALKSSLEKVEFSLSYIPAKDGSSGYSLEVDDGQWRRSYKKLGTPGQENSTITESENICKPDQIKISEIFPFSDEFVEVENNGEEQCDLLGWSISDEKNGRQTFPVDSLIDSGKYLALEKDFGLNNSGSDSAILFSPNGAEIEKVTYEKAKEDFSYSKNENDEWEWTTKTPGEENYFEEEKEYENGIIITELFPNPFKSEYEEYIELFNNSEEDIDLQGWTLRDSSKAGKYTFAQSVIIEAEKYLAIFKKDFKFALNNSGNESVTLFDPNEKEVSTASYDGSKKNVSYNFNGSAWKWSKILTPGKENIFNNGPQGKIKLPKEVYEKVYADFSISVSDNDGEKIKVVWNFGDGHKSYKENTRHKYAEKGTYNGSVKYSDDSENVVQNFTIEVEGFPHPEVKIISVNANPEGSDTKNE